MLLQAVWGQFAAFVRHGWSIHAVCSKNATDILLDACKGKPHLVVRTFQVCVYDSFPDARPKLRDAACAVLQFLCAASAPCSPVTGEASLSSTIVFLCTKIYI